jgi:hypothetical protein
MVQTQTAVQVTNQCGLSSDQQIIVLNRMNQDTDTWQAIALVFQQSSVAAVRVTHPYQYFLDAALRIGGSRRITADSVQHIQHSIDRTAEAGLIVFNVIINEQHEIQT